MNACYKRCISEKFLLSDNQLAHLIKFLPAAKKRGRPASDLEASLQGIFYLLKTGCQWNALPRCFGPDVQVDRFVPFAKHSVTKAVKPVCHAGVGKD